MCFAFHETIGDQTLCDPDGFRLTRTLSDRARISFTNPHEVDGVLVDGGWPFIAADLIHHPGEPDGVWGPWNDA